MDNVESGRGPERYGPPLTQTELGLLFMAAANTLVKKGTVETATHAFTPEDSPEALVFYAEPDPQVVKDIFYPKDERVEILGGKGMTYISYTTPHIPDQTEPNEQESYVYINIAGSVTDVDVTFQAWYMVTEGIPRSGLFSGVVAYEYSQGEGYVDEVIVGTDRLMMMLMSERRELNADDAQKIRRLLDRL